MSECKKDPWEHMVPNQLRRQDHVCGPRDYMMWAQGTTLFDVSQFVTVLAGFPRKMLQRAGMVGDRH